MAAPAPKGPVVKPRAPKQPVRAAGCVVVRQVDRNQAEDGQLEVLVAHRDRYDDWSFPKGKLDEGETEEQCAVRELLEETGLIVALGCELPTASYTDHKGRPKTVRYWQVDLPEATERAWRFEPNEEVDEVRWLDADSARALLSYDHDLLLLDHLADPAIDAKR